MTHGRTESSSDVDGDATYVSENYEDHSHYYYNYTNSAGEQDGFIRHDDYPGDPATNLLGVSDEDRGTFDKVVRFMELAADTVVGDLRNDFVCTEDTDDHTSYSITLELGTDTGNNQRRTQHGILRIGLRFDLCDL